MQARAKVGGEIGINGFWYDGGQFLPNTRLATMSKRASKEVTTYTSRKQEIEPFVWECPPSIGVRSLWDLCNVAITFSETGKYAVVSQDRLDQIATGMGWGENADSELKEQAERWLAGERWISQDVAPFFWWAEVKKNSQKM